MPAPPKIRHRGRLIGLAKIQIEIEPQDAGRAPGHVGIAREVAVNLEGEGQRGQHQQGAFGVLARVVEDGIDEQGQPVGHHHFLEQAPGHEPQPTHNAGIIERMLAPELRQHVPAALDGPGHQLREKCHEQRKPTEIPLRFQSALVHINDVAHRLKRVERHPHRQQQPQRGAHRKRQMQGLGQLPHAIAKKIEVLENEQRAQVAGQAEVEPRPPRPPGGQQAHAVAAEVVEQRGGQQQQGIHGPPAHVEVVAGQQQQGAPPARRQAIVEPDDNREKDEEMKGIE